MLDSTLYNAIFKRKSFHMFRSAPLAPLSEADKAEIMAAYKTFVPLFPDIKTDLQLLPAEKTTCRRGQEYCILLYSEKKDGYLQNIGFLGQQLDLYLVSHNFGTLWYGLGKTEQKTYNGLDYVIMFGISKLADETKFRTDMFSAKRKPLAEIWSGDPIIGVSDIARFAPSACNSQPWEVERMGDTLTVYRRSKRFGIMTGKAASFLNRIDMGIFLCFLELCLAHTDTAFQRELFSDDGSLQGKTKVAEYTLQ